MVGVWGSAGYPHLEDWSQSFPLLWWNGGRAQTGHGVGNVHRAREVLVVDHSELRA